MNQKFSQKIKDVLAYSREEAIRLGNTAINPDHLFLGILRDGEGEAINLLLSQGLDLSDIKKKMDKHLLQLTDKQDSINESSDIVIYKSAERALKVVFLEARSLKSDTVNTAHLLLAILKDDTNFITQLLYERNVSYESVRKNLTILNSDDKGDFGGGEDEENESGMFGNMGKQNQPTSGKPSSDTPVLDNFGIDLTKAAEEGRLDPIIGREREIERIAQILSRRKKNNPILIGEPGVGKSAIAEGLALRIVKRKVSRVLFNKRVVTLDLASIVAGTKYRGQFEERMKAILNELSRTNDIILFIDEIHTIVGAGGATGSLDAANMLKPALARGELQCIGATTLDEYREHIEKDGALERRFQKVMVEPTSPEETVEILNNIKERYEDHHNVVYTPEAIDACVKLTMRYISDRHLPDKAIDALDESGSRVHISNIKVPENIISLEKSIEETKKEKLKAVKNQQFELAANLRDKEKRLIEQLEDEQSRWEKEDRKSVV